MSAAPGGACRLAFLVLALVLAGCLRNSPATGATSLPEHVDSPNATPVRSHETHDTPAGSLPVPSQAAWAVLDASSLDLLAEAHPEILDTPVQPGSLMKIVTLAAAGDAGLVNSGTAMMCARRVREGTHVLDCAHPDLRRPLTAVDAIAYSCNSFFAQIARRLTYAQLSTAAIRLGLPPVTPGADIVSTALGLDAYRVPPRRWLSALLKLRDQTPQIRPDTRALLLAGLRDAASRGTADALANQAPWLAKTGTAPMPGGGVEGLAVAASLAPRGGDRAPGAVVVVAPGASGKDAAAMAASLVDARLGEQAPAIERSANESREVPVVRLGRAAATGYTVESVPLETYVAGVLAAEAPPEIAPAALSALATVTRTYVLKQMRRHAAEGFDVCDLTHCQVVKRPTRRTLAAAEATRGIVLTSGGRLADVYYSASCGGTLASADEVWGDATRSSNARSSADPAGDLAAEVEWSTHLTAAQIIEVLHAAGLSGRVLEDLGVATRSASGRVALLRVPGFSPDRISGERFRMTAGRVLGWQTVKSTRFDVTRTAAGFTLLGRGHGHGVGMCLRGADALGAARSAEEILAAYFPAARLERLANATGTNTAVVRLVVPWGEQPRSEGLRNQALRIVSELADQLGVAPPQPIRIRFHASVEAYERATAARWWTAASTRGAEIDLLPLTVLESRGILLRTLRHELTHVLTEPFLQDRPRWVREGLAVRFDGSIRSARASRMADCPGDGTFESAASAEGLEALYEKSASCVEAALSDGTVWRDVGATSRSSAHPSWATR